MNEQDSNQLPPLKKNSVNYEVAGSNFARCFFIINNLPAHLFGYAHKSMTEYTQLNGI